MVRVDGSGKAVASASAQAAMRQTPVIARYAWPTASAWQPPLAAATSKYPMVAVELPVRPVRPVIGPATEPD